MVSPATNAVIAVAATSGIHMFTSPTMLSDCEPSTVVCRMPTTPTSTNRHKNACSNERRSPPVRRKKLVALGKREHALESHEQAGRNDHRHNGEHACRKRPQKR